MHSNDDRLHDSDYRYDRRPGARLRDGQRQSISLFHHGAGARRPDPSSCGRAAVPCIIDFIPAAAHRARCCRRPYRARRSFRPRAVACLTIRAVAARTSPHHGAGIDQPGIPICRMAPKRSRTAPRAAACSRASTTCRGPRTAIHGRLRAVARLLRLDRWIFQRGPFYFPLTGNQKVAYCRHGWNGG